MNVCPTCLSEYNCSTTNCMECGYKFSVPIDIAHIEFEKGLVNVMTREMGEISNTVIGNNNFPVLQAMYVPRNNRIVIDANDFFLTIEKGPKENPAST